jgi:hypothetical protein
MISQRFTNPTPLVGVLNRLWCGSVQFKLCAQSLQVCSKRFNLAFGGGQSWLPALGASFSTSANVGSCYYQRPENP